MNICLISYQNVQSKNRLRSEDWWVVMATSAPAPGWMYIFPVASPCLAAITMTLCDSSRHKEAYTWTYPMCCVHNIILGKLWIEQYGTVEIVNHR